MNHLSEIKQLKYRDINDKLHLCQAQASRNYLLATIEIEMEVTHIGPAPAKKNKWGQTSRSYGKDSMQGFIMQYSRDPNDDIQEIDIETKLLEIELRQQRKRESREKNTNLSPSHEPIF